MDCAMCSPLGYRVAIPATYIPPHALCPRCKEVLYWTPNDNATNKIGKTPPQKGQRQ